MPEKSPQNLAATSPHDPRNAKTAVNPAAMTPAQLAQALGVAEEQIRRYIAEGAPAADGGIINLVHFAAWLNRKLKQRETRSSDGG